MQLLAYCVVHSEGNPCRPSGLLRDVGWADALDRLHLFYDSRPFVQMFGFVFFFLKNPDHFYFPSVFFFFFPPHFQQEVLFLTVLFGTWFHSNVLFGLYFTCLLALQSEHVSAVTELFDK